MVFDIVKTFATVEEVVLSSSNAREGLSRLIHYCQQVAPENEWSQLLALDIESDITHLQNWLQDVLLSEPPPQNITGFWFGLIEAVLDNGDQTEILYIAGSDEFVPDDDSADWACDPVYFPENRYVRSSVIDDIYQLLHAQDGEIVSLGEYLFFLGYAGLLLRQILPKIDTSLLLGSEATRGVAVGFDDGDFIIVGELTSTGWVESL